MSYLCEHGTVVRTEPGWLYREGEDASCFYVLLDGALVMSRKVVDDDVEVSRTAARGSYVGAWTAYLGDLVPQVYDQSVRVTETSTFFELDARVLRDVMIEWFPMAQHLLAGLFQGFTNRQRTISQRERLLALGSLSAGLTHELNNPDPRQGAGPARYEALFLRQSEHLLGCDLLSRGIRLLRIDMSLITWCASGQSSVGDKSLELTSPAAAGSRAETVAITSAWTP